MDVSKAIDKAAGADREVIGRTPRPDGSNPRETIGGRAATPFVAHAVDGDGLHTAPATEEAKQWDGWGTALKPSFEIICIARKPLIGTVAANVLEWGTGAINVDSCRVGTDEITINRFVNGAKPFGNAVGEPYTSVKSSGRWPANLILDEAAAELLDEQSGITSETPRVLNRNGKRQMDGWGLKAESKGIVHGDSGGASRFFFCAKADRAERDKGLEGTAKRTVGMVSNTSGQHVTRRDGGAPKPAHNDHPTVKPVSLMQYLVRLVTPPGGTVLDPFMGSGSTGIAADREGFDLHRHRS